MKTLLIFLLGAAVGYWLGKRKDSGRLIQDSGIGGKTQKDERKEKIMQMFEGKTEIRNDDVEKALGVSDATATNYLSELEKEGKIEQVGTTGRFVSYKKQQTGFPLLRE